VTNRVMDGVADGVTNKENAMRDLIKAFWPLIVAAVLTFTVLIGIAYFQAIMEAKAYNRLTGAKATAWDAMWVELRVTP
jgi:phage shock protein PspC (stress-responsive transcriptional regulator)